MYFLLINRRTKETIMNYSQMTPELVYQDIYNNMNQDVPRADRMSGGRPRRTGRLLYQHRQKMEQNKQEILYVIKSWINTKDAAFGRYLLGQKADLRVYTSRLNIARALIGEVESLEYLKEETRLAKMILGSGYMKRRLVIAMQKVVLYWLNKEAEIDEEDEELSEKQRAKIGRTFAEVVRRKYRGPYSYYYKRSGFWNVIQRPERYKMGILVAVLHDIMDYFSDQLWGDSETVSMLNRRGTDVTRKNVPDTKFWRRKHTPAGNWVVTVIESSRVVKFARQLKMPISCGPSFTTLRILTAPVSLPGPGTEHEDQGRGHDVLPDLEAGFRSGMPHRIKSLYIGGDYTTIAVHPCPSNRMREKGTHATVHVRKNSVG